MVGSELYHLKYLYLPYSGHRMHELDTKPLARQIPQPYTVRSEQCEKGEMIHANSGTYKFDRLNPGPGHRKMELKGAVRDQSWASRGL